MPEAGGDRTRADGGPVSEDARGGRDPRAEAAEGEAAKGEAANGGRGDPEVQGEPRHLRSQRAALTSPASCP